MKLTVVIPTRNRAMHVQRLVTELNDLHCEIIVVDDCSQPAVQIERAKVIHNPQQLGSGESRNIGCSQAKSDWLLLVDDDLLPSPGLARFVDALLPRLDVRDVVGFRVVGLNRMGSSAIKYNRTGPSRILNILFGVDMSPRSGPSRFVPSVMIVHTRFFASLGGFDSERYAGNGFREESDLQLRARKMGGRITYVVDPSFFHLNISGGHEKGNSTNDIYFMRNQVLFALRMGGPSALIMILSFGVYLAVKRIKITKLVGGIAQGLMVGLKSDARS